ncbi:MAG: methyltransferase domain-containing protein [Candidatus Nanoarchaeia archaeon]|jgi:tRNA (adenine57-N1/adenine58-N1)-methyltransferase|nr:methyltransferase domain-containing protein [Candidatus Nanoarchaeia archaeon]
MKKILIRKDKKYYWNEGDLHTASGVIKEEDLKKSVNKVKAHSGKEFSVAPALFIDKIEKIKRDPQAMLEKDIALILTYSSIDKDSIVLEAGTGSGKLTSFLARIVKKVYSYDKNKDNLNLAKKNLDFLDIKNVELKNKDIYENIDEKELDLIVLDLPMPWKTVKNCYDSLKQGSFLISYLPTIPQVMEFIHEVNKHNFLVVKTIELIEREWMVEGQKTRPKSSLQHTAFLTFVRKL